MTGTAGALGSTTGIDAFMTRRTNGRAAGRGSAGLVAVTSVGATLPWVVFVSSRTGVGPGATSAVLCDVRSEADTTGSVAASEGDVTE